MKTKLIPLVSLMVFVASASVQVTLEIKHQEKTTHTTQTEIKIAQTLQLAGQEIVTKNLQILITEHATGARAGDGTLRIKTTIKKRTGKWEFPGGIVMEFDSAVPDRGTGADSHHSAFLHQDTHHPGVQQGWLGENRGGAGGRCEGFA